MFIFHNRGSSKMSEVFIHRKYPSPIIIDHEVIHNKNISLGAKGLFAFILSYEGSWLYNPDFILDNSADTKENVEKYYRELINAGLISYSNDNEDITSVRVTRDNKGFIYIMTDGEYFKIGISSDVAKRLRGIQTNHPQKISVILSQFVKNNLELESFFHEKYKSKRVSGEWFRLDEVELKEAKEIIISKAGELCQ
jgi:hypothetical protein